jgi:hypothetical protein
MVARSRAWALRLYSSSMNALALEAFDIKRGHWPRYDFLYPLCSWQCKTSATEEAAHSTEV